MLLRLRGPDGMIRVTVEKTDTFSELGRQVWHASHSSHFHTCGRQGLINIAYSLQNTSRQPSIRLPFLCHLIHRVQTQND